MALKAEVEDITTVEEPFRALYTEKDGKHVLTGVEGMVPATQLAAVKTEAGGYRIALKEANTKLTAFGDLKPEDVRTQLARIPELELAAEGKIDDKKIDTLVEGRIAAKLGPVARERDLLKSEVDTLKGTVTELTTKERTRVLGDSVRAAGKKAGVQDSAIDDAIMLGEKHLEVDGSGNVVTRDKVGVTPGIDPVAWLQEIQPKRPHWWGPTQGGGAGGSRGVPGFTGNNPFSNEHWNMTEQGKLVRQDRKMADQLAAKAGTSVGGTRPAPKK